MRVKNYYFKFIDLYILMRVEKQVNILRRIVESWEFSSTRKWFLEEGRSAHTAT